MMPGIDPAVFQIGADLASTAILQVSTTAHDVRLGGIAFNYPWGDNLADEGFVGALIYLVKSALSSWEQVEADRAMWGEE